MQEGCPVRRNKIDEGEATHEDRIATCVKNGHSINDSSGNGEENWNNIPVSESWICDIGPSEGCASTESSTRRLRYSRSIPLAPTIHHQRFPEGKCVLDYTWACTALSAGAILLPGVAGWALFWLWISQCTEKYNDVLCNSEPPYGWADRVISDSIWARTTLSTETMLRPGRC